MRAAISGFRRAARAAREPRRATFQLILIKPSHYDDEGYVIQWLRSVVPSNSLGALYGLGQDCARRGVLGPDIDIVVSAADETNSRVRVNRIRRQIRRSGGRGMVGLVGVQTNQFARALDIARPLRAAGIQVCIGGFHVSGCLAMLPQRPPEIEEALALGISLFAGEGEGGRLDEVLRDACAGGLKPIYDHLKDMPDLAGAVAPFLLRQRIKRTIGLSTSFDAGRGCPFECSFCTIINVQGRKSRHRSPDDVADIIRANLAQGIKQFFITDDNFARNRAWEPIFDRLIELRERDGLAVGLTIQVDTLCHKIPRFIEKAGRAGIKRVFIGLENINPESLAGAKKRQNRITEYRAMLQAWKGIGATTYAGYIIGFPADSVASVMRDIAIIKRELPVDVLEFFYLTPLPGSADHKALWSAGVPMDSDMNRYDLNHVTTAHPQMSRPVWEQAYRQAWQAFFSPEHMETVLRRAAARGGNLGRTAQMMVWFYGSITFEKVHPLEGGYFRLKFRRDRRPTLPRESAWTFYPRYGAELAVKHVRFGLLIARLWRLRRRIKADPTRKTYLDQALSPVQADDLDQLEIFAASDAARDAADRKRRAVARQQAVAGRPSPPVGAAAE
jgi:hypothetical protein